MLRFLVVVERVESNSASSPELPGAEHVTVA